MRGIFSNGQPIVEIEVRGVTGISKKISALVDSGFNGYLQLPFLEAFPIGLVLVGIQDNTLADGRISSHFICNGQVYLDGKGTNATIDIQPANIVLLGTKLLKELGKVFTLDCAIGKVEITDRVDY